MKTINEFISTVITEASLDARIPDGMVDLKNTDHLQVVAEAMYDACENEEVVNEFLNKFMDEGKHPDRQAFNKEGWLVTFPSKEYRDAAIKKGTHAISDPTHGKGGMNLYYKRKGKQKRQTQQATTATQTDAQKQAVQKTTTKQPIEQPSAPSKDSKLQQKRTDTRSARLSRLTTPSGADEAPPKQTEKPQPSQATSTEKPKEPTAEPQAPAQVPAVDVPVVTTPPAEYASISQKFAKQKGWTVTEYGEYHDREGNPVAVVGLSGEIVPIRNNDREEYKIFAEKQIPA